MFDPNLPQENTPADAVQVRSQLQQVMDKVDELINALRRW